MRIIAFINRDSGAAYHRIVVPLLLMPDDIQVFITNDLLVQHFDKGCDLLIYNRILPDHAMEQIRQLQKIHGFRICVDVDDYWELDPHHILYQEYEEVQFAAQQIEHLRNADLVTTTHARLASEIMPHNSNVHVLPNAIPRIGQFDVQTEPSKLTRFFWQGSITHKADISILSYTLSQMGSVSANMKMVMGGYVEGEPEWYDMAHAFTAGLKMQYKLIPAMPVTSYYEMYKHADICLVPLVKSRFNAMKSPLKILEAANLGLPVIASDVDPYREFPTLKCKSASDWAKHMKRLLESSKRRDAVGGELAEYCKQHYSFSKINKERKEIFEHETSKAS